MKVLEVRDLKKSYQKGFIPRRQEVLKGISFSLEPGAITGFLGANGAGKTTTIKCILGLAFPDSGSIQFFDGQPLSSDVKSRIGFLPERPYFYEYLTGAEFLQFYGQLSTRLSRRDLDARIDSLLKRLDLLSAKDKRLRSYSKGMLQKIGMAQALIHRPEFVILDEPKSGLDPDGRYYLSELIRETAREGTSVFFSSHLLNDAERLCERLVIMRDGAVIFNGRTEDLLGRMGVKIEVIYAKDGQMMTAEFPTVEAAQPQIRELAKQNATIHEIRRNRASLEEIFVNIALRGHTL